MSILIKNVLLNGNKTNILIKGNLIEKISSEINEPLSKINEIIDCYGKMAIIPSFANSHTHAAMALLRGYADDMPLHEWLNNKIWPTEAKLSEEDVYWGAKLACLEMIKSGTTLFNDMYWNASSTAKAAEESGIRAIISPVFIDLFDEQKFQEETEKTLDLFEKFKKYSDKIKFALGPHAIYTVSEKSLKWIKQFADKNNLLIHIHLSETKEEVESCLKQHNKLPVKYLEEIGFLGENIIAAHCIHLDEEEIEILKEHNVKIIHNPVSNMKLASGIFPYEKLKTTGLIIGLGTDGNCSNNNLDILEEMKFASLLQKINNSNPAILSASETFELATKNTEDIFNIKIGKIQEGYLADLLLVDLTRLPLIPNHNLISNLVYSSNRECINTTICNGKILMQNRKVPDEEKIKQKAQEIAFNLINKK